MKPNAHGVYSNRLAEKRSYRTKKATVTIFVLQIGRRWISAYDHTHHIGNLSGNLKPLTLKEFFESREAALSDAINSVVAINREVLKPFGRGGGCVTPAQRAEAKRIIAWAGTLGALE
jgi:hypothetical protein